MNTSRVLVPSSTGRHLDTALGDGALRTPPVEHFVPLCGPQNKKPTLHALCDTSDSPPTDHVLGQRVWATHPLFSTDLVRYYHLSTFVVKFVVMSRSSGMCSPFGLVRLSQSFRARVCDSVCSPNISRQVFRAPKHQSTNSFHISSRTQKFHLV